MPHKDSWGREEGTIFSRREAGYEEGRKAGQTSTFQVTLERASKYVGHSLPIGALLPRSDSHWRFVCLLYTARIIYQREGALLFRKCYIRGQSTHTSRSYLEVPFPEFRVPRLPPLKLECGRCPGAIKKSGTSPAAAPFLQMPQSRFAMSGWVGWWVAPCPPS